MKILHISYEIPYFPGGSGGQTRIYHLLKELSTKYEFDLIAPRADGEICDTLRKFYRKVIMPEKQRGDLLLNFRSFCKRRIPLMLRNRLVLLKKQLENQANLASSIKNGYPSFVQQMEGLRIILSPLVQRALLQEKYDLIQIEHSNIAHWLQGIKVQIPCVLIAHNIKTIMWKRYHQNAHENSKKILFRDYKLFQKYESEHFKSYDCIVAMSEIDKKYILELCGEDTTVSVVPNGVDTDYFYPGDSSRINPNEIAFVGTMNHPPNIEAVIYFCDKIFPAILMRNPSANLSIVGNSPSAQVLRLADRDNIRVTGFVPDTRPYFSSASVVVVPLLSGSGTRLKILEAMSMGKAVVSTGIGAEGIDYTNNENIMIANDESSFIEKVIDLMANPVKRISIGLNARRLAVEKYSWKLQAERMENVYSLFNCSQ